MIPHVTHALLTYGVAGVILVLFVALVVLLAIQQRRLRVWKRAHRLVRGDYRAMRDRYFALQRQYSALLDDVEGEVLRVPALPEDKAEAEAKQTGGAA